MLQLERECWNRGLRRVAGVDEAGRGPLAGPVYAAAVVMDPAFAEEAENGELAGLTDSKRLSPSRREAFLGRLEASPHVAIGVGICSAHEIDTFNILQATHLAMRRALRAIDPLPEWALIDGLPVKDLPCGSESIVKGDGKSLSIAAASIVAKVLRDRRMLELDARYPQYGFSRHKGYGSKVHMQALFECGPCPEHRRSFRPVREAEDIKSRARLAGEETV